MKKTHKDHFLVGTWHPPFHWHFNKDRKTDDEVEALEYKWIQFTICYLYEKTLV